jgi:hypothetical protein
MAERSPSEVQSEAAEGPRLVEGAVAAEAWARLEDAFARASATVPDRVHTSWWSLAGRHVRGRVVGTGLAQSVGRAFNHLRMSDHPPSHPELSIDLWDGEATGVSLPPATILTSIPGWHEGGGISTVSADRRYYLHALFDSRAILDREARRILCWTASSRRLSLYERGKPLRVLLSVWLHDRSVQLIHAALVSSGGRGVLLPGRGGMGKTTSALACLLGGLDYLGDDYIGLERHADGSFTGHSLYESTWLDPDHLVRFPVLAPHAIRGTISWERKRLIHLSEVLPERLAPAAAIRLLAFPTVGHGPGTRWRPAAKSESLLAMAPTSVFELTPRVGAAGVERLAALVARLPTYRLELGERLPDIPRCLDELLTVAAG